MYTPNKNPNDTNPKKGVSLFLTHFLCLVIRFQLHFCKFMSAWQCLHDTSSSDGPGGVLCVCKNTKTCVANAVLDALCVSTTTGQHLNNITAVWMHSFAVGCCHALIRGGSWVLLVLHRALKVCLPATTLTQLCKSIDLPERNY